MHGLNPTLISIFFLAAAPVALMPSIISIVTRQKSARLVLLGNFVLWGLLYWGVRSFTIDSSSSFRVPTFLALLAWLALLGFSLRNSTQGPSRQRG